LFGEIATGATKVRAVDDADWGQNYSAIDGSWLAFEDYSVVPGYDAAVTAKNIDSEATVTLPDDIEFTRTYDSTWGFDMPPPPYKYFEISYQWYPDISYPWVTWMVDDYPFGNPLTTDLWYFQVAAQNISNLSVLPLRVTYQDSDALFPSVDGNLVVWEDYRNDPDGMLGEVFLDDNPDIYICDLSDVSGPSDHYPPVYPLCTAAGPQFVPRISGDLVVWEDWRDLAEPQSDLYLYDLSVDSDGDGTPNWKESPKPDPDPAEIQLTDTFWPEEFPDIDGRNVVWMDLGRDTGLGGVIDIYLMDIDSPTAVAVATNPATFRYHPRISGTKVVWEDWRNGQPDVYWVDASTGAGGPIAASTVEEEWPDISGDNVAYPKLRRTRTISGYGDYDVYNVWAQDMLHDGAVGAYSFSDVTSTYWAWEYIEAAVTNGVVQGYPEGDYKPTVQVTRDQMAVFIARALAGGDASVPEPTVDPGFTDVSTDYWAYKYIAYAVDSGVVQGYPEGDYRPSTPVTRGQMSVFIARALAGGEAGVSEPTGDPSFPDVPDSYWAYKYVEYIKDADVTQGYLDGTYRPEVVVTRDQMAVYISRAFDYVT
ncbi:MAG: S-layer homology domain-containing protein, partial [Armatimonadetes bacterium]|nr:S-layer homology domain-containing protein [Armatimonadota bacterium]